MFYNALNEPTYIHGSNGDSLTEQKTSVRGLSVVQLIFRPRPLSVKCFWHCKFTAGYERQNAHSTQVTLDFLFEYEVEYNLVEWRHFLLLPINHIHCLLAIPQRSCIFFQENLLLDACVWHCSRQMSS